MIEQWLRDKAVPTALELGDITRKTAGDGAISGYGMKNKVRRLIAVDTELMVVLRHFVKQLRLFCYR